MKAELERIREVFNDAFSDNWHFLPLSRQEYLYSAKSLFAVTNPGLIRIVEHNGNPVAVLQCVLNVNPLMQSVNGKIRIPAIPRLLVQRKAIHEVVVYAVGIKKAYQRSRAFILLTDAMLKIAKRYPVVYSTWMSDDNIQAVRSSEIIGLQPYKWFEVYGKKL
jgi:rRNA-processing protein FCF1